MKKHIKIIIIQGIFIFAIGILIYLLYPRINFNLNGNAVKFDSINANVIIISNNPDFSNPRYIDLSLEKNLSLDLDPGTYYWKSDNGLISGISHEFTINSTVGLEVNNSDNGSNLVNVGDVKINVTKDSSGVMVGHIILEPNESQKADDNGNYVGRQA